MPFNLRSNTAVVADGSITTAKLADDAVTTPKLATSAVTDTKIATDAVTSPKIATDAVTTVKIAADAVTSAKVTSEIVTEQFFGTEQELSSNSATFVSVGEFNFIKNASAEANWNKLGYQIKLRTSSAPISAHFRILIGGVAFGTEQTTNSITAVIFQEGQVDISSLAAGNHLLELQLRAADNSATAFLSQADIFLSKK